MKSFLIIIIIPFVNILNVFSQPLVIQWQQCYGGSSYEYGNSIVKTQNGFMLFGGTDSDDGQITGNHGKTDFWLISTDSIGNIIWSKTYGGTDDEYDANMKPCSDGGYVMFGSTFSNNGNVSGNHGAADYWVVKVDSVGNIQWQKCLGGTADDFEGQIDIAYDSGFYCNGYTFSVNGNVTVNYGPSDMWVLRMDKYGNLNWQKSIGSKLIDEGICILPTVDGGVVSGGFTSENNGNVLCNLHGNADAWLVKLDYSGNIEWQKCYGGSQDDVVLSIISIGNGGYIFVGGTYSNDGDVSGNHGKEDFWVVKIDSIGNIIWQHCYGGSEDDFPVFIKQSSDGNFLVGGSTYSNDGDVSGNHSGNSSYADMWLIKISPDGNLIWQQCFGSIIDDALSDILELPGGQYAMLGGTESSNSGNVNCNHHGPGTYDVWFFLAKDTTYTGISEKDKTHLRIKVMPNPFSEQTEISFNVRETGLVGLDIFNLQGQKIKTIRKIFQTPGTIKITWDGTGTNGNEVSRGIYVGKVIVDGKILGHIKLVKMQ